MEKLDGQVLGESFDRLPVPFRQGGILAEKLLQFRLAGPFNAFPQTNDRGHQFQTVQPGA